MIQRAASYLPPHQRTAAVEVAFFSAAGHRDGEIAKRLGIKAREVSALRDELGDAIVYTLRDDGFTDGEIARSLGIATALMPT